MRPFAPAPSLPASVKVPPRVVESRLAAWVLLQGILSANHPDTPYREIQLRALAASSEIGETVLRVGEKSTYRSVDFS